MENKRGWVKEAAALWFEAMTSGDGLLAAIFKEELSRLRKDFPPEEFKTLVRQGSAQRVP